MPGESSQELTLYIPPDHAARQYYLLPHLDAAGKAVNRNNTNAENQLYAKKIDSHLRKQA